MTSGLGKGIDKVLGNINIPLEEEEEKDPQIEDLLDGIYDRLKSSLHEIPWICTLCDDLAFLDYAIETYTVLDNRGYPVFIYTREKGWPHRKKIIQPHMLNLYRLETQKWQAMSEEERKRALELSQEGDREYQRLLEEHPQADPELLWPEHSASSLRSKVWWNIRRKFGLDR